MGKIVVEVITPTKCEILSPVTIQLHSKSSEKKDVAKYVSKRKRRRERKKEKENGGSERARGRIVINIM